ncbi:MAG: DUF4417 domain-containing protein [Selenomonadaceae bacterium]|nr:DUF4417 domain-containing protein [Selenomonadaceae bacterium]
MTESAKKEFVKQTKAFLVEGAKFVGKYDMPECPCTAIEAPKSIISYVDINKNVQYDAFAHFYIDDYKFDNIWNKPYKALERLKHCSGVITPDFSTYQDMPIPLKIYNTYRMRAFGYWLTTQGIAVINNVRWGTPESYDYCFSGIPQNSIVSIGTVGCIREKCNWQRFNDGLEEMVQTLKPRMILVYGSAQDKFFAKYSQQGIPIIAYPSKIHLVFEKRRNNE